MTPLSNEELLGLLKALHMAIGVAIRFPPDGDCTLYLEMADLWEKIGTEAISRGLIDRALIWPPPLTVDSGLAFGNSFHLREAIEYSDEEVFWDKLHPKIATTICRKIYGEEYANFSPEKRQALYSAILNRVSAVNDITQLSELLRTDIFSDEKPEI